MSGPGALCRGPALSRSLPPLPVSGPGALCVGPRHSLALCVGARARRSCSSACHPSGPRAAGPNSDPRATHPARCVPSFQERTPNLTVWGKISPLQAGRVPKHPPPQAPLAVLHKLAISRSSHLSRQTLSNGSWQQGLNATSAKTTWFAKKENHPKGPRMHRQSPCEACKSPWQHL